MASNPPPQTPSQSAAQNNADMLARTQDQILPETWQLNRWMLASLLAINSAAAATVYGKQSNATSLKIEACQFFVGGVIVALLSGFVLMLILQSMDRYVTNAQRYWAAVAAGGSQTADAEEGFEAAAVRAHGYTVISQVLLYVSLALFLLGLGKLS